jgi:hypothetical protein
MLLYVIRDWDGSMDIDSAISKLTKSLLSIWMAAAEGAGFPAAAFADYFRLGMITLPHKVCPTITPIFPRLMCLC